VLLTRKQNLRLSMWDWNLRLCVPDKGGEVSYERGLMKDGAKTLVAKKPNTTSFLCSRDRDSWLE
jgi:hypothetical protein